MTEEDPFRNAEEPEPTRVPLKGPNVTSTLGVPPRPDAVRAQEASIRKHLRDRRGGDPPGGPGDGR